MQVCETLDRRKGITDNIMWPVEPVSNGDEKEDAVEEGSWESLPAAEKLSDVLTCLRTRHSYCLFCGCQVFLRITPGTSQFVHINVRYSLALNFGTFFLNVFYVILSQYESRDAMEESCPGATEDVH